MILYLINTRPVCSLTSLSSLVHKRDLLFNTWIFVMRNNTDFRHNRTYLCIKLYVRFPIKSKRIFVKECDRFEISFVCMINSGGLLSGSVVAATQDIPLPRGGGGALHGKLSGWGQARGVGLAVRKYKFAALPGQMACTRRAPSPRSGMGISWIAGTPESCMAKSKYTGKD